jgi:Tfp pilus assembly pilus retraction ATPase PilT
MAEIDGLLKMMSEQGSSDLHVKVGSPPAVRLNGRLRKSPSASRSA